MTAPDFIFDPKRCDLSRGGRVIALCKLHVDLFACLVSAQGPIGSAAVAKAVGIPIYDVIGEIRALAAHLDFLSISIASSPRGRWLVFEPMRKWQPDIPPPVRLEGEAP